MPAEGWYYATPENKLDSMLLNLKKVLPGKINLFVVHVGIDEPEMSAMVDANPWGPKDMSKHRNGELNALISPQFQKLIHDPKYRLINYHMVKEEQGLDAMKRPAAN